MRSLKEFVLSATEFRYLEGKQKTCGYINRGVEPQVHRDAFSRCIRMSSHLECKARSRLPW